MKTPNNLMTFLNRIRLSSLDTEDLPGRWSGHLGVLPDVAVNALLEPEIKRFQNGYILSNASTLFIFP